jgi:Glu-tRNA(Gln) amidotransferase subunit E-like FAD-binding protein
VQNKTAKFTFTIPEGHPESGTKIEKSFEYKVVDNEQEALSVIADRKWSIVGMVNDNLKANARSNAYQNALMPYKPSEVSPEDIKERMIRDFIRMGLSEEQARANVESTLKALADQKESVEA